MQAIEESKIRYESTLRPKKKLQVKKLHLCDFFFVQQVYAFFAY